MNLDECQGLAFGGHDQCFLELPFGVNVETDRAAEHLGQFVVRPGLDVVVLVIDDHTRLAQVLDRTFHIAAMLGYFFRGGGFMFLEGSAHISQRRPRPAA